MATKRWIGNALAVPQVSSCAITANDTGTHFSVQINGKAIGVPGDSGGASTTAADLAAALNSSSVAEFMEITWSASGTSLIGTADVAGKPFTASSLVSGGTGTMSVFSDTTSCTGPNFWNNAANWDAGAVPASSDDVYIENTSVDILYGLSQSSTTLHSLNVAATFTGNIGLPQYTGKYQEYRPTFLAIGATSVNIGYGSGSGSPRIRLDVGSTTASVIVSATGSSNETGLEAFCFRGTSSSNTMEVVRGNVAIAALASDSATLASLKVGYVNNVLGDSQVRCGVGATVSTIVNDGGANAFYGTLSSATLTINAGSLTVFGTTNCGTFTINGGTLYWNSTGTLGGSANFVGNGGTLDVSQDLRAKTIATGAVITCTKGATINDPNNVLAAASGAIAVAPSGCSVNDLYIKFGIGRSIQEIAMSIGMQGLAYFPGIDQLMSASYTLAHGITPGVIQVEMAPQANFTAEIGSVVFSYGDVRLEFDNCKVDSVSFDASGGGFIWNLAILDRRWMWAFGKISGHYNQYNGDGTLKPETKKTAAELCTLCLAAMGEQDYDTSQVPGNSFPTIDWDYDVPAQVLASLADGLGCHVVLKLDGTVAVLPTGNGDELPSTTDLQSDSLTIDPPEKPDSLVIVGSPTRYQLDLQLQAVDWNTDNTIQPLNRLSYAPDPTRFDGGFNQIDIGYFNKITDPQQRALAIESIFRWYQIDPAQLDTVPGYGGGQITDVRQILPIGTEQVVTEVETSLGQPITHNKPAQVFGVWFDSMRATEDANTCPQLVPLGDGSGSQDQRILYSRGFQIEAELGLVKFNEPVYRKVNPATTKSPGDESDEDEVEEAEEEQDEEEDGGSFLGPADLMLRTSVLVRDAKTWAVDRYERQRQQENSSDAGTQPRYIVQNDIELAKVANYGGQYDGEPTVTDNKSACDQEADYYLDAAEAEYDTPAPQSRTYAGLQQISPDGAILQVTWAVSMHGATTSTSRSDDRNPFTVPYSQRRLTEQVVQRTAKTFKTGGQAKYSGGGVF